MYRMLSAKEQISETADSRGYIDENAIPKLIINEKPSVQWAEEGAHTRAKIEKVYPKFPSRYEAPSCILVSGEDPGMIELIPHAPDGTPLKNENETNEKWLVKSDQVPSFAGRLDIHNKHRDKHQELVTKLRQDGGYLIHAKYCNGENIIIRDPVTGTTAYFETDFPQSGHFAGSPFVNFSTFDRTTGRIRKDGDTLELRVQLKKDSKGQESLDILPWEQKRPIIEGSRGEPSGIVIEDTIEVVEGISPESAHQKSKAGPSSRRPIAPRSNRPNVYLAHQQDVTAASLARQENEQTQAAALPPVQEPHPVRHTRSMDAVILGARLPEPPGARLSQASRNAGSRGRSGSC